MQTSESFRLSALLAFSGGLQDAYTYNIRDRVFANAQTGNVVLMSQSLMQGNFLQGLRYMCPLLAFVLGIFTAERTEHAFKDNNAIHWRQIIILLEIAVLFTVGFLPTSLNMVANMAVSFACAMQVQTFRTVHGYGYASTMCIGNLRSGTESLSRFLRDKDKEDLQKSLYFFGIILIFALGAGLGGVFSNFMGAYTIWISVGILVLAELMMIKESS